MAGNDELRAKAREAAFLARIQCAGAEAIADAVLSAILPELDARVRAAREGALEEAAKVADGKAETYSQDAAHLAIFGDEARATRFGFVRMRSAALVIAEDIRALALILPELDARVRAAREGALEEAVKVLREAEGDAAMAAHESETESGPSMRTVRLAGRAVGLGIACGIVKGLARSALARGEHRETEGE